MKQSDFLNQPMVRDLLWNSHKRDRLSHAYLFYGMSHTAKINMAYYLMMMLYCKSLTEDGLPCLECPECQRIIHHRHVNTFWINPDGKMIKRDSIDSLLDEFQKKSMMDGPRIYCIDEADKMNLNSSNSLLKFMEESPEGTIGILCTNNMEKIPNTIISRCETVYFSSDLPNYILDGILQANIQDLSEDDAYIISRMSSVLEEGLELAQNSDFLKTLSFVKSWMKQRTINKVNFLHYFFTNEGFLYENQNTLSYLIQCLYFYSTDILKSMDHDDMLVYVDCKDVIKEIASHTKRETIEGQIALLTDYTKRMNYNVKLDLALHSLAGSMF